MLGVPKHFMEAKKERSLSRFIPYSCVVTPHTIKTREGDYLRTWKLSGVPFETVDPVDLAVWKDNLNTLFRSIGSEKISLYVHQVRRQTFDRLPATFQNSFCRQLDENYYHSFGAYRMLRNELYFTLVYRPNSGVQRRLLRVARTLEDIKRAQEKALQSLNEISSQVESGLSRYKPKLLGNRTEQGITFSEPLELLNFLISGSWQPVRLPGAPLYEYLGTSQVIVGTETIELRGVSSSRYLRMLDLKDYPTETEPGIFDGLLYAKVEYVLTQSFSFVSTATGKAALIRQRNQLSGADEGSSSQVQQMNEAIDSLTSGDFAVGEYHFSLAVFGEDLEQLRNDTTELQVMLQNAGFLPALVTTALDAAFFSQLPANWAYRTRPATLTTRNFASFAGFHNFKQGKRNKNPWGDAVTLLQTPSGAPYYYNFHTAVEGEDSFDQKVLGNTLVLGQSGAGKTVLLTFLLCQVQKFAANSPLGFTSFFFDKDRGAELAVRALGGKYLALETGQPSGLNPFQLEPTNENLQFLEQLIEVLVCGDGHKLSPADKQRISEAVRTVMRFPREIRRLGLVPQNMTEGSNREGSVVQRLARWCSGGALAWVFDNETDSLDFTSHQNYGIDGTSFLDNAAVRTPISLYLLHRMEQVIDGRRFLFFMDEFWKWVGDSAFSDFVFNKLKTIRKQNGFGVFATQSPSDVLSSDIARAIVEQCATGIYLPNPRADKKEYVEGFGLTEAEFGLLCELGESSRLFLVKQGKTSALAGLQLKGFDRELAILSGSTDNIALFQEIKQEVGENPDEWMPPFFDRLAARKRAPNTLHKQP